MEVNELVIVGGFLTVVGIIVFWYGFNRMHRFRIISDIPTSTVRSVAIGITELNGNVQEDTILSTPFSKTKCVYYKYEIKEYRRVRTGKSTSYTWKNIASGERYVPFYIKDDTGSIYVDPFGANISVRAKKAYLQKAGLFPGISRLINSLRNWNSGGSNLLDVSELNLQPIKPPKTFSFAGNISFSFSGFGGFGNRVGDRRYHEYFLAPGDEIYLIGTAANSPEAPDNILIKQGRENSFFMVFCSFNLFDFFF